MAANAVLFAVVLIVLASVASRDGRYAVMAWPGSPSNTTFDLVARAGGKIIATGGSDSVVITQSDDPDFRARLFAEGAFLVFNPLLAGPCRSST